MKRVLQNAYKIFFKYLGSVMVWGSVSTKSVEKPHFVEGIVNIEKH